MSHYAKFHYLASTLKFKQLELVCEIYKHHSLLRASEHMNMTQSAATKTLRKLEDILEVKLFHRTSTGMVPTEIGIDFIEHAHIILTQLRQSSDQIHAFKQGTIGNVNVGVLIDAATYLLPEIICRINAEYPSLQIKVVDGLNHNLVKMLKTGDLDIILGRLPAKSTDVEIEWHCLYNDTIQIVCAIDSPIHQGNTIQQLKDLAHCNWIFPPEGTSIRTELENSFYNVGVNLPQKITESVSAITNIYLLKRGNFVGVLPSIFVNSPLAKEWITTLPVHLNATLTEHGYQIKKSKEIRPNLKIFTQVLQQVASEIKQGHINN